MSSLDEMPASQPGAQAPEPRAQATDLAPSRATHPPAELAAVLEAGGPDLAQLLESIERRLLEIAEGHGEALARHTVQTLDAGGKRVRPIMLFLSAGCSGGYELVHAATAVELVHMATLIHDDVLDQAELRRGRPTVFVSGGRGSATATGDLLFSRAYAELSRTRSVEAVRELSSACWALARGELMQRGDAWASTVTAERYLLRCEHKTARLFEASCRLGALAGGSESSEAMARFGARVGLAFQILDDVLDVSGPAERTGKTRGADLLDGTITLPFILARDRDPELRDLDLRVQVGDPGKVDAICDRIAASGALDTARDEALRYVTEAKRALEEVPLQSGQRRALGLVADGVVERYA